MLAPDSKNWFTNKLLEENSYLNLELPILAPVFSMPFFFCLHESSGDGFIEVVSAGKQKPWGGHLSGVGVPGVQEPL